MVPASELICLPYADLYPSPAQQHLPALAANAGAYNLLAVYSRSQSSAESLVQAVQTHDSLKSSQVDAYFNTPEDPARSLEALLAREDIST